MHCYVRLRSNFFKTKFNFFPCLHDTVVTFLAVVNNFKPTATFVSRVTEAKSHIFVKLSLLLGERWQQFWTKCTYGQSIFNMNPAQDFERVAVVGYVFHI